MRHSAFVCPAASINYDLLKWISLGALACWPKRLDGHMYLFEQVHHSMDSCSADDARRFCKHTGSHCRWENETRRETKGHSSLSSSVTRCARTAWRESSPVRPAIWAPPDVPPHRPRARLAPLAFSRAVPSPAVPNPNLPRGLARAAPARTAAGRLGTAARTAVGGCPLPQLLPSDPASPPSAH